MTDIRTFDNPIESIDRVTQRPPKTGMENATTVTRDRQLKESLPERILVIDDDRGFLTLMKLVLERYEFTVITAQDGQEGLRKARETTPDLILLDIMMPGIDGWDTCQQLRRLCDAPIIMLTALEGYDYVARAFSVGADDYVTKPCSFDELKKRILTIRHVAKAEGSENARPTRGAGRLSVDLVEGSVTRGGEEILLTPAESRVLFLLASQRGQIMSHRELLVKVWGPQYAEQMDYLVVCIHYLREKIEDDPSRPQIVRAHAGVGYSFEGNGVIKAGDDRVDCPDGVDRVDHADRGGLARCC